MQEKLEKTCFPVHNVRKDLSLKVKSIYQFTKCSNRQRPKFPFKAWKRAKSKGLSVLSTNFQYHKLSMR